MRTPRTALVAVIAAGIAGCAPAPADNPAPGPAAGALAPSDAGLAASSREAADVERGELLALACLACHTVGAGQAHALGPNLDGIIGAEAAAKRGFDYSAALAGSGLVWTLGALDAWIAAPEHLVPGTSMVFAGYAKPDDRRDLIAYLQQVTRASRP